MKLLSEGTSLNITLEDAAERGHLSHCQAPRAGHCQAPGVGHCQAPSARRRAPKDARHCQ